MIATSKGFTQILKSLRHEKPNIFLTWSVQSLALKVANNWPKNFASLFSHLKEYQHEFDFFPADMFSVNIPLHSVIPSGAFLLYSWTTSRISKTLLSQFLFLGHWTALKVVLWFTKSNTRPFIQPKEEKYFIFKVFFVWKTHA